MVLYQNSSLHFSLIQRLKTVLFFWGSNYKAEYESGSQFLVLQIRVALHVAREGVPPPL